EEDLPNRLSKYDGDHVTLRRIALTREHVNGLPSFPATDKRKDPRYKWFVTKLWKSLLGTRCDGPKRSSQLRRQSDLGVDRARGVEALRDGQPGGAGIAEDGAPGMGHMSDELQFHPLADMENRKAIGERSGNPPSRRERIPRRDPRDQYRVRQSIRTYEQGCKSARPGRTAAQHAAHQDRG